MACAGDVPTLETLAAVDLLRQHLPDLKVRVINVVDLMKLQPASEHPHGLDDFDFDVLFTKDKPVIFAYHGYPWLIHRLTYRRTNHRNIHVRGYKEEGTTTTPFDMSVLNDLDRFHLFEDVDRPGPQARPQRRLREADGPRQADRAPRIRPQARRGHARDPRLEVERLASKEDSGLGTQDSGLRTRRAAWPRLVRQDLYSTAGSVILGNVRSLGPNALTTPQGPES